MKFSNVSDFCSVLELFKALTFHILLHPVLYTIQALHYFVAEITHLVHLNAVILCMM